VRLRFILLSLLGLALAAPAWGGELDRSFEAADGGRLVIALGFGSVAVRIHDQPTVRIAAVSRGVGASSVRFDAYSEGGDVFFRGTAEPWVAWLHSAPGVRVEAWVPRGYRVELAEPGEVEVEAVAYLPPASGPEAR
jgi:hypothetical protein